MPQSNTRNADQDMIQRQLSKEYALDFPHFCQRVHYILEYENCHTSTILLFLKYGSTFDKRVIFLFTESFDHSHLTILNKTNKPHLGKEFLQYKLQNRLCMLQINCEVCKKANLYIPIFQVIYECNSSICTAACRACS